MPTPETLENILIQFTQHQFSMFPTESAIDQFLPPSGLLGFHKMQEGLNSLVVEQKAWNLTTGIRYPFEPKTFFKKSFTIEAAFSSKF